MRRNTTSSLGRRDKPQTQFIVPAKENRAWSKHILVYTTMQVACAFCGEKKGSPAARRSLFSHLLQEEGWTLTKRGPWCPLCNENIETPYTHPNHPRVGHFFKTWSTEARTLVYYYCDSYDKRIGFWMTNVTNLDDRRNVPEQAIDCAFHRLYMERELNHVITQWEQTNKIADHSNTTRRAE